MATVQEFINDTLILINVLDAGSSPSASESFHALNALNRLIGNWSSAGVPVYTVSRDLHTLVAPFLTNITIGPSGNIPTIRPLKIRGANIIAGLIKQPMEIVTAEQYGSWVDLTRTGKFAKFLYYDAAYPLGNIWMMPVPASGGFLELFSVKPMPQFASLSSTFDLPPGYEQALQYGLALAIAPSYHGAATISPAVTAGAAEAKEAIARLNVEVLGAGAPVEAVTTQQTTA